MATIAKVARKTKGERTTKWSVVLKRIPALIMSGKEYVLLRPNEGHLEQLKEAPVDRLELQDGTLLVTISRFCRWDRRVDGAYMECTQDDVAGKAWASVKLRHAHYDWARNGKKGVTDKLELVGCSVITLEPSGGMGDLHDAEDDELDGVDIPF